MFTIPPDGTLHARHKIGETDRSEAMVLGFGGLKECPICLMRENHRDITHSTFEEGHRGTNTNASSGAEQQSAHFVYRSVQPSHRIVVALQANWCLGTSPSGVSCLGPNQHHVVSTMEEDCRMWPSQLRQDPEKRKPNFCLKQIFVVIF